MLALNEGIAQPWLQSGNPISSPSDYLGCDGSSIFPLNLKTRANQPIDFSTADLFRARINPKISYPIGPAPTAPRNGFMLLSGRDNFTQNVKGPFTRLHLVDDVGANNSSTFAQEIGYRQWMRNGITFTGNSDHAYIGQKYAGDDNTDFVIQWSDNPEPQPWGTDRMKFIFSSQFTGDHTGMGSEYGLEAMRLWPKNSMEVNVGIGDFFAYGGDPTERLHVRDGRVRIQQLPDNPEADHDFKVMVVDNSNDPLERGVVKWKDPSQLGGSGCDSTIQNNGISGPAVAHSVFTAVGSSDLCPDDADAVGIGTNSPKAKLHVVTGTPWFFGNDVILGQLRTNAGGGRAVHGSAMATSSYSFSPNEFIGVKGRQETASTLMA